MIMPSARDYKEIISGLPDKPGIYQFLDDNGTILYVGKARSLKKRVASYFTGNQSGKTNLLIKKTRNIRHIVVDTESDALLLENNLIKKHQPRYNILLKDDKTFPWICIKSEPFPRVFSTRNVFRDGSNYYGPYTSALMVRTLITLIRQLIQLRTCSYNLTPENINSGKLKVCLEYHIGNCKAPCIGLQNETDYNESIRQIKDILKGNISGVMDHLRDVMLLYSSDLKFEEAQKIKEKIELLSKYKSKSTIVSSTIIDVDVFGYAEEEGIAYINYMKVYQGAVIQAFNLEIRSRIDEERESLLATGIIEIRQRVNSNSSEIIIPFLPDIAPAGTKYVVPEIGDKRKLLDLAVRNAIYYKLEQRKKRAEKGTEQRTGKNLEKVKNDLHMPLLPVHIECFDNSNIMGTNPVAACVIFRNGKPSKKDYRHFNIKSVTGPDDYSSMEEIVFRRYKRMMEENQPLPQLIIIDGGKGQLSSAMSSIDKLNLRNRITVIGIAKKLEEIYFPGDSVPIYLDKNSYSLKLIQQLRNEAHRFGINFHRGKRSIEMTRSILDEINGIGPKTKEILLKHFDSIDDIRKCEEDELKKLVGNAKAGILTSFFTE
jgi:excinuclease ABC subunit C